MQPILYTDTDQIRAILGITDDDMDDTSLVVRGLDKELSLDLLGWIPTHADISVTGTQEQQDALTLYSTYFCSGLVVQALRLSAVQKVGDGSNEMDRFSMIDWEALIEAFKERKLSFRNYLVSTIAPVVTSRIKVFSGIGLGKDPVTGS